jgi:putative transcriptional regulator
MPMTEKDLLERDAERDIGAELLQSVREMKAGKRGRVHRIAVSPVLEARHKVGLSQARFAVLLGVSKRTLQDWEQGRREPSGAAKSLLKVAEKRPDVLREIFDQPR